MGIPLAEYWRLLRRYLAPQRGAAALMAVLFIAHTGLAIAAPQVVRTFIDAAMAGAAQAVLVRAALVFLVVSLANRALGLLANYCGMRVGWTATNALRIDLVAHLVRLDLSFHKAHPPGALIERVDGDVDALADFFSSFAVDLVGNALLMVGILVVVTVENPVLGVMLLVYCVLSLALLTRVQRLAPPHWRASRQCEAEFYGYVGEMLTATEDIRASGATDHAVRRFLRHLRTWWPVELRGRLWGSIWLATAVVSVVGGAVARALAGPMAVRGTMTLGMLYMIAGYMEWVTWGPIQGIQWRLQRLQHAQVSIVRVRELLNTQPEVATGGRLALPPGPLSLAFRNLRFTYPDALPATGGGGVIARQTPRKDGRQARRCESPRCRASPSRSGRAKCWACWVARAAARPRLRACSTAFTTHKRGRSR